jgi:hypothetical protein
MELRTNYYSSFTQGRTCKINLYIVNLFCDILLGLWQVWDKKENHLLKLVYLKKSILQYLTCEPASLSLGFGFKLSSQKANLSKGIQNLNSVT